MKDEEYQDAHRDGVDPMTRGSCVSLDPHSGRRVPDTGLVETRVPPGGSGGRIETYHRSLGDRKSRGRCLPWIVCTPVDFGVPRK